MYICGYQKLTLLDFPGRTACTVFTGGCNFRCPFCHNASLVLRAGEQPRVPEEELFAFLEKRRGLLDGVAVTGGEPTLQSDLPLFLKKVREMGYQTKLDTNGARPGVLRRLIEDGLVDYVAMDIKSSPGGYAAAAGLEEPDLSAIRESAALLMEERVDYEFRTTAVHPLHTPADFEKIGRWLAGAKRYFIQCYKDSGDIICGGFEAPGPDELREMLQNARKYIPQTMLRGVDE